MAEGYNYSVDLLVNKKLTETEKNKLFIALGNAIKNVLGKPKDGNGINGVILIYSEKE
jgi:hypothetical protein